MEIESLGVAVRKGSALDGSWLGKKLIGRGTTSKSCNNYVNSVLILNLDKGYFTSVEDFAEALGAFGLKISVPALKNSLALDPAQEVRETCEMASSRIEKMKNPSLELDSSASI
ncbi:unnamed protein product [Fraxinus pennsylvanica]|uniref:Uncharacterized protein n=1 Tax=Fraxinus pennsylvanica TaxID=56036 RepID=A0AAD1ZNM1_9LAMI|nr:unnamed protein product [Fraxinus pennsylvanica]